MLRWEMYALGHGITVYIETEMLYAIPVTGYILNNSYVSFCLISESFQISSEWEVSDIFKSEWFISPVLEQSVSSLFDFLVEDTVSLQRMINPFQNIGKFNATRTREVVPIYMLNAGSRSMKRIPTNSLRPIFLFTCFPVDCLMHLHLTAKLHWLVQCTVGAGLSRSPK